MTRHRPAKTYGHKLRRIDADWYRMSWVMDFYYRSSRLRHPRVFKRDTDLAGAKRFAKRHGIALPEPKP
jgi:hypothetical protein